MPPPDCSTYATCVAYYTNVETLLICFGSVGFLAAVCLNVVDFQQTKPALNWSAARAAAFKEKPLFAATAAAEEESDEGAKVGRF